jgi:hypothetical protein
VWREEAHKLGTGRSSMNHSQPQFIPLLPQRSQRFYLFDCGREPRWANERDLEMYDDA